MTNLFNNNWLRRVILIYVTITFCSVVTVYLMYKAWRQPSRPYIHLSEPNLNGPLANMSSDVVINTLQLNFLVLPPENRSARNTDSMLLEQVDRDTAEVIKLLNNNKRDGFLVESSQAWHQGNCATLELELELGWTGLIIEGDPVGFARLVDQKRHVVISPTCVSVKPYPMMELFVSRSIAPKDLTKEERRRGDGHFQMRVQCFPLYSYLLAVRRTTVDYLSLYLEGHELEALQHVPFDKVDIRIISIGRRPGNAEDEGKILSFMQSKGYINWGLLNHAGADRQDAQLIFYKNFNQ